MCVCICVMCCVCWTHVVVEDVGRRRQVVVGVGRRHALLARALVLAGLRRARCARCARRARAALLLAGRHSALWSVETIFYNVGNAKPGIFAIRSRALPSR